MLKKKIIPYNKNLKPLAKKLRNESTKSEIRLWQELKHKKMRGYDFHRQKPLLNYIVDFYCPAIHLAIELDGYSHHFTEVIEKDEEKELALQKVGVSILRFQDSEVMKDMPNVLRAIEGFIMDYEERH